MASTPVTIRALEVKSYAEEGKYIIFLSGHITTVMAVMTKLQIHPKMIDVLEEAQSGYMKMSYYDDMGSNVRKFANDYVRVMQIFKRSSSEEVEVFSREQVTDFLLNDGWKMIGFSGQAGPSMSGLAVVERWVKSVKDF